MRYFRYKHTNRNVNHALKEQYKTLTADEKRTARREKRWRRFSTVVALLIYCTCLVGGILLLRTIPLPPAWYWKVFGFAGKVLAGLIVVVVSGVITVALTMPLWKRLEGFHIPTMKKEIFSKASKHLRDYYQLQEPYLITKCFAATDRKFCNHDVCLFVVGDELRITTDLVRGFLHGERDLGCYCFKAEEIVLSKGRNGNHLALTLIAGDTEFTLGYRAKGFIEAFIGSNATL